MQYAVEDRKAKAACCVCARKFGESVEPRLLGGHKNAGTYTSRRWCALCVGDEAMSRLQAEQPAPYQRLAAARVAARRRAREEEAAATAAAAAMAARRSIKNFFQPKAREQ